MVVVVDMAAVGTVVADMVRKANTRSSHLPRRLMGVGILNEMVPVSREGL